MPITPSTSPTIGDPLEGRKKRLRTISNLTEEQLQHKRHVDRQAQRALRQRTKNCIKDLEERLAKFQQSSAQRENQFNADLHSLQSENEALKQSLQSILQLATSGLSHRGIPSSSSPPTKISNHASYSQETSIQRHSPAVSDTESPLTTTRDEQEAGHPISLSPPNVTDFLLRRQDENQPTDQQSAPNQHTTHTVSGLETARSASHESPFNVSVPFSTPEDRELVGLVIDSRSTGHSSHTAHYTPSEEQTSGEGNVSENYEGQPGRISQTSPFNHLNGSGEVHTQLTIGTSPHSSMLDQIAKNLDRTNVANFPPLHLPATCPLDHILLDFLRSQHLLADEGTPLPKLLGPLQPSMKAILDIEFAPTVHPISRVMSDVLSTFPHVELPEKMAFMYLMFHTMRWQISPVKDSYQRMPDWLRPTATQVTIPHGAWLDNIPWPGVRDILIENPDKYPFEVFSEYYSQNVSVNWPHDSADAVNHVIDDVLVHTIFEKHIRKLSNWTVSQAFRDRFPEMCDAIYSRY